MGTNEKIFERVQAGIESTRGTGVAATRIVYFAEGAYELTRELSSIPTMNRTQFPLQIPSQGRLDVGFRTMHPMTFEDAPWDLEHFVKGGLAAPASDAGSPPAYTRSYAPATTTDDLKSSTWEIGEPSIIHKSTQVMGRQLDIRIDPDNAQENFWKATCQWFGRDFVVSSFTGALADRVVEAIPARGTLLYLDTSLSIGATQVTGRFINASLSFRPNRYGKAFGEDRMTIAANKVGIEPQGYEFDAQIQYEYDATTELGWFLSDTPTLVKARIVSSGSQIHGGTPVNKFAAIRMVGYISSWVPGYRRGNRVATLGIRGFYDPATAMSFDVNIINGISGAVA